MEAQDTAGQGVAGPTDLYFNYDPASCAKNNLVLAALKIQPLILRGSL
jgi:hypothetical protein